MKFNKSLSYAENNLNIPGLPLISYGENLVQPEQIPDFMRKLTSIDNHLSKEEREGFVRLESIILNDLQLFLNYYHYARNHNNTPFWRNVLSFLYQPCTFLKTKVNDHKFIQEVNRVFEIEKFEQALWHIQTINLRIEEYLGSKPEQYWERIENRTVSSLDLLIYSACKAERIIGVIFYII
jgi:hypothetical protein